MTQSRLNYLGPIEPSAPPAAGRLRRLPKLPMGFLWVVVVPTAIAMIYYLLIASPRYVSEAQFMVRSGGQDQPSALGVALQGVGLSSSSTNAFAVHQYITSRDSLRDLSRSVDVKAVYGRRGVDFFSRRPLPWQGASFETFYGGFQNYVTVGYDSTTGISTLRVEAFTPQDANAVNVNLLKGGEQLINRLNARSSRDAVVEAQRTLEDAQLRLTQAQSKLTAFRNSEGVIDPARTAQASVQMIGELKLQLATLTAERNQVAADTPASPQLPTMNSRIRALQQQITLEEAQVAGQSDSLAPKISAYEDLTMEKEFSDRLVASATASLNSAQLDARRQHLYLEQIVSSSLPDKPEEPRRWYMILSWFVSTLVIYGLGWLIVASIRESKAH
jgi:capsular polysaccharide transport system permease protein